MQMWSALRLLLGTVHGGVVVILLCLNLPGMSAPTTMSSTANIAYAVLYVHSVTWVSLLFGLILPLLFPGLFMRPCMVWLVAVALEVILMTVLLFLLDLGSPSSSDRFAVVTWKMSSLASLVAMMLSFFVGIRRNRWLLQRAQSP